jgi:hypothetical protein
MAFTRTLGRTHPLVTAAPEAPRASWLSVTGQAAHQNEELSLPQPVVKITFFGSLVSKDQRRREASKKRVLSPTIPTHFSLADTVIG